MFPLFDTSRLKLLPLAEREHDLDISVIRPLEPQDPVHTDLDIVASRMIRARQRGSAVVMMLGAHVIRSGVQRYLIDLMEKGHISCIAVNGAGVIHDFEFALIGKTTESVSRYIREGQFGLWQETGQINDIVRHGADRGMGLGEAVGREIETGAYPHREISLLAAAYRLGVPVTVHVGIGYDIIHEHPNFDGASCGAASHIDFLRYARVLESLEGGVLISLGSAVMAPEIFLKALAMVRNVSKQEGRDVRRFTVMVCDLNPLPGDFRTEPEKGDPGYFFRPWKTLLIRTVQTGGESFYVKAGHAETVPRLWTVISNMENKYEMG